MVFVHLDNPCEALKKFNRKDMGEGGNNRKSGARQIHFFSQSYGLQYGIDVCCEKRHVAGTVCSGITFGGASLLWYLAYGTFSPHLLEARLILFCFVN